MFGTHLIPVTRTEEEEKKKKEEGGRRRGCGNVANRQRFGRGQPANFMLRTEMIKDICIYIYIFARSAFDKSDEAYTKSGLYDFLMPAATGW